jgi:hypothetical protein
MTSPFNLKVDGTKKKADGCRGCLASDESTKRNLLRLISFFKTVLGHKVVTGGPGDQTTGVELETDAQLHDPGALIIMYLILDRIEIVVLPSTRRSG